MVYKIVPFLMVNFSHKSQSSLLLLFVKSMYFTCTLALCRGKWHCHISRVAASFVSREFSCTVNVTTSDKNGARSKYKFTEN